MRTLGTCSPRSRIPYISSIHSFIHTHYTLAGLLAGWVYDTTIAAHTTCEIQLFSFRWTKAVTDRHSNRLYYACSLIYRQWSNMWELSYVECRRTDFNWILSKILSRLIQLHILSFSSSRALSPFIFFISLLNIDRSLVHVNYSNNQ